jgi:hypothetical protein
LYQIKIEKSSVLGKFFSKKSWQKRLTKLAKV